MIKTYNTRKAVAAGIAPEYKALFNEAAKGCDSQSAAIEVIIELLEDALKSLDDSAMDNIKNDVPAYEDLNALNARHFLSFASLRIDPDKPKEQFSVRLDRPIYDAYYQIVARCLEVKHMYKQDILQRGIILLADEMGVPYETLGAGP